MSLFIPSPAVIKFPTPEVVYGRVKVNAEGRVWHSPRVQGHEYPFASAGTLTPWGPVLSEWFDIVWVGETASIDRLKIVFTFDQPVPENTIALALADGIPIEFHLPVGVEQDLTSPLEIRLEPQ